MTLERESEVDSLELFEDGFGLGCGCEGESLLCACRRARPARSSAWRGEATAESVSSAPLHPGSAYRTIAALRLTVAPSWDSTAV